MQLSIGRLKTVLSARPNRIDWANPLSAGLVTYQVYGYPTVFDPVAQASFGVTGVWKATAGAIGFGMKESSGTNARIVLQTPTPFPADDAGWTMRWVFSPPSSPPTYQALVRSESGGITTSAYLKSNQIDLLNGGADQLIGPVLTSNLIYDVVITKPSGAVRTVYLNGASLGTTGSAATAGLTSASGLWGDTFSQPFTGTAFLYQAWTRVLSPSEIMGLYASPFDPAVFPEDDIFAELVGVVAGGFTAKFRRTLSPIGSRVGSRQTHGWGA